MKRSRSVQKSELYTAIRGSLSPLDKQTMMDAASYVYNTNPKVSRVVDTVTNGAKTAAKKIGSSISSGAKTLTSQMKASANAMAMSNLPLQTSMARSLQAEVNVLNSSTHRLLDELLKASPPRVGSSASPPRTGGGSSAPPPPANSSSPVGGTSPANASPPPANPSGPVGGAAPPLNRQQRRQVKQQVASGSKGNQRSEGSVGTGPGAPPPDAPVGASPTGSTALSEGLSDTLSGIGSTAWSTYNAALGDDNAEEKEPALQIGAAGGAAAPMLSGVTSAIQPRVGKSLFAGSWFNNKIMLD